MGERLISHRSGIAITRPYLHILFIPPTLLAVEGRSLRLTHLKVACREMLRAMPFWSYVPIRQYCRWVLRILTSCRFIVTQLRPADGCTFCLFELKISYQTIILRIVSKQLGM